MLYASTQTIEDLQRFTSQRVPVPAWVKTSEVAIPSASLAEAATVLQTQLGRHGIEQVGGKTWWQWRRPGTELKAEWIEMRSDYAKRKKTGDKGRRVMFYVHGGSYFFGSVDTHRYQLQRHARKLNARVFAPRYRLAPQFPFPCALHDCLAAYLYLLSTGQEAATIVMAGDSAGAGMIVSLLCTLRDQGLPLPAGAVLISPWVDLTHSFPSVAEDSPFDYVPPYGFHHRPSPAWPPPNADDMLAMEEDLVRHMAHQQHLPQENEQDAVLGFHVSDPPDEEAAGDHTTHPHDGPANPVPGPGRNISIELDGKVVELIDQIHMYTTNQLITHPLVSPILQPSLGGLPPLLILVGGGELLRDEQIYLAHKAAAPAEYPPADVFLDALPHEHLRRQVSAWPATSVQLQVWDDLCHVTTALSFTRPAKSMYRSIGQFSAWALARAQKRGIDIPEDDASAVSSSSSDDCEGAEEEAQPDSIGKAGDRLPPFRNHMIRQRVSRHGILSPLPPASELPALNLPREQIGIVKAGPVRQWIARRLEWDRKFAGQKRKVQKQRVREMAKGYEVFGQEEVPPPSAAAGRRIKGREGEGEARGRSWGLKMWSLWGSSHDERAVAREAQAEALETGAGAEAGDGAGVVDEAEAGIRSASVGGLDADAEAGMQRVERSMSRRRTVTDLNQTGEGADGETAAAEVVASGDAAPAPVPASDSGGLLEIPDGKTKTRPKSGGVAFPFSLKRELEGGAEGRPQSKASMTTLTSGMGVEGVKEVEGVNEMKG